MSVLRRTSATPFDIALPATAVGSLLAACVIRSAGKYLWTDEILSKTYITDPSLAHMLRANLNGVEGAPPFYHVTAWLWARTAGGDDLSLRLLSSLAFCLALVTVWLTLRGAYGVRATAVGVLTALCSSHLLLSQNVEVRFYGLFTFLAALVVWLASVAATRPRQPWGFRLVTWAAHVALVLTHPFGLVYSAVVLAALVINDLSKAQLRVAAYAPVLLAWPLLLPWLRMYALHAELNRPRSWLSAPTVEDLLAGYSFWMSALPAALLACVLWIVWEGKPSPSAPRGDGEEAAEARADARQLLMRIAYGFLLVPIAAWIIARLGYPTFLPRYFLPSLIAWPIVLAHLVSLGSERAPDFAWRRPRALVADAAWLLLCLALLAYPVHHARNVVSAPAPPGHALRPWAGSRLPVAFESIHDFLDRSYYAVPEGPSATFILDWDAALDPRNPPSAVYEYKAMVRLQRWGYFVGAGMTTDAFLCTHSRFLVSDRKDSQWYEWRLQKNPDYQSRPVGTDGRNQLILVERRPEVGDDVVCRGEAALGRRFERGGVLEKRKMRGEK